MHLLRPLRSRLRPENSSFRGGLSPNHRSRHVHILRPLQGGLPDRCPPVLRGNEEFTTVPSKEEIPSAVPFLRFLRNRRSLRLYQDRPVEKGKLRMLLEAGRFAPTGGNRQACEYVLVSGRKKLDEVRTIAIQNLREQGKAIQEMLERHHRLKESIPEEMVPRLVYPPVWTGSPSNGRRAWISFYIMPPLWWSFTPKRI